jgi:hypothetical protein
MPELSIVDPIQQMNIGLNQHALDEWVAEQNENRKRPMSDRAIKMAGKKLLQWSEADQMRIVEHGIECGWTGLYWVEPPKQPKGISTRDSSLTEDLNNRDWAK